MKLEQIFVADLRKCTGWHFDGVYLNDFGRISADSEFFKQNAILIKISDNQYIDLETLESTLDYIKVRCITTLDRSYVGGLIIPTFTFNPGAIFVDESTLKPYLPQKAMPNHISFKKLQKQMHS